MSVVENNPQYSEGSALRKLHFLFGQQFMSRIFTFVLNLQIVSKVGPVYYGLASVHLYLPYTVVLFLAREALRRVSLRYTSATLSSLQIRKALINLAWLCVVFALGLSAVVWYVFTLVDHQDMDASLTVAYQQALALFVGAAVLEMLSEPIYVVAQKYLFMKARLYIETIAVILKCLVTYILIILLENTFSGDDTLLAFGLAQCIYSLTVTVGYYYLCIHWIRTVPPTITEVAAAGAEARDQVDDALQASLIASMHSLSDVLPGRLSADYNNNNNNNINNNNSTEGTAGVGDKYIDTALAKLTLGFTVQSFEKLLLTEGQKIVLVGVNANLADQGVFSVVSNLGSLVARFVFQPLEESSYAEFSLLFAEQHKGGRKGTDDKGTQALEAKANVVFYTLLKFVILIGCIFVFFGPNYSYVLFDLIYGEVWSATAAPQILSVYCLYVLFMAVNGITEAFLFAVITPKALVVYNTLLVVFSAIYMGACWFLLPRYGTIGLIIANCINMSTRILFSVGYVLVHFKGVMQVHRALPGVSVLLALATSAGITYGSRVYFHVEDGNHSFKHYALHIAVGALCVALVAIVVYLREKAFLHNFASFWSSKKQKTA